MILRYAGLALLLALLCACARTVLVSVPPRVDLAGHGIVGIVEFASNSGHAVNAHATRQFQAQIHAAQPGTRIVELGELQAVLAAVGSSRLDADALKRIGAKHGVAAVFLGDIVYSEPKTDVKLRDLATLDGSVRSQIRGDISSRLMETATGASVWSSSAWARRPLGRLSVSAERGVSGTMSNSDPREEMVPALVYQLTHDFRPRSVRQPAR